MPYSKWSEINDALKGIKPKISLTQANLIAKWADAMEQAEDGPESPWAAAIAQFKKLYQVQGGKWVKRKVKEYDMAYRGYFTSGTATVEVRAIKVNGEAVPVVDLVAAYEEQRADGQDAGEADIQEATMKTVDGKKYSASDFLVVEDSEKPTTWHLQVKRNGKPDHGLMGGAKAALTSPGGHRGNKYEGPGKEGAIKKLKALYKAEDMPWGKEKTAEVDKELIEAVAGSLEDFAMSVKDAFRVAFKPVTVSTGIEIGPELWPRDVFKDNAELGDVVVVRDNGQLYAVKYEETDDGFQFATRENWRRVVLTYVPVEEETAEVAEAELSESASGHALALAETDTGGGAGPRAPLLMDVALIKPGFGNKKDKHYYSREVLKRDAHVFEGVKMYATDHRPDEKSVRTEVAVVKACPVAFADDGAPIAQVAVHDGDFAEQARNRAKLGTLGTLECSILALGKTKKGDVDGQKANIVEAITKGQSVDWVTKAGAGGHALNLAESDTGGVKMDKEQIEKLLSESDLPPDVQERLAGAEYEDEEAVKEAILKEQEQAQEEEAPQKLEEAEVAKLLSMTSLPSASKKRLAGAEYEDETALRESVLAEVEYIKKLTGSGQPFGQGGGTASDKGQMSEADYDTAYDDILTRHGLHVPQQEVT